MGPTPGVPGREPLLFTPGPLTTSQSVKLAMCQDLGSRDSQFLGVVDEVRTALLDMAHTSVDDGFECVIVQGSGTFAVESVVSSVVPRAGAKLLVLSNGAYGDRIAQMCDVHNIDHTVLRSAEAEVPCADAAVAALDADPALTHVAVIHHETTTGALNPIWDIGPAVKAARPDATLIVDSMSGFGCYDVDLDGWGIDYLVSSSNKCIEGVPGFAFALARRDHLVTTKGHARSLSLDLLAQWEGLRDSGQFRFTPPTHSLLAFRQALREHAAEGGQPGRLARYTRNFEVLRDGLGAMGFVPYLPEGAQGCIITTFLYPDDPNFDFPRLYQRLQDAGIVIYPGKLTDADCFRMGSIGRLFERDMHFLVQTVRAILGEMGVALPVTQVSPESNTFAKTGVEKR